MNNYCFSPIKFVNTALDGVLDIYTENLLPDGRLNLPCNPSKVRKAENYNHARFREEVIKMKLMRKTMQLTEAGSKGDVFDR